MKIDIFGKCYEFPLLDTVLNKIPKGFEPGKIILITGQPGSGKSAFMQQLYGRLKDKIDSVTAVSAEYLGKDDSPKKYYDLFDKYKVQEIPKILLLDSLDVLAYSRRKELQQWLYYVDRLRQIKGVLVVCASRTFEATHLYPMNQQDWSEKFRINPLDENFINDVLQPYDVDISSFSPYFIDFLKTPLHLRLTAEIFKNDGDLKNICTLHGLYAKLFEVLNLSSSEQTILSDLSRQMIENKSIYLDFPSKSAQLLNLIKKLERPGMPGVIQIDEQNKTISFSHQTMIDFFSAWKVINERESLLDFIYRHKQSLFIRPTLKHIIAFLRNESVDRLFDELRNVLLNNSNSPDKVGFSTQRQRMLTHIKTAIISDMAAWDKPTSREADFLLRIFNQAEEFSTIKLSFFNGKPDPDWYLVLKDKYLNVSLNIEDDDNLDYRLSLSFIASFVGVYSEEILALGLNLVDRKYTRMLNWFFRRILKDYNKMVVDNKVSGDAKINLSILIEKVVRNGFADRSFEVEMYCRWLTRLDADKAFTLYMDMLRNELSDDSKKINSSQGSITQSFLKVLPDIYIKNGYKIIIVLCSFFDEVFADSYKGERYIYDNPSGLLFGEYSERFGLNAFYVWFKGIVVKFCKDFSKETSNIIAILQNSSWETQQQLAIFLKAMHFDKYRDDLLKFIFEILDSDYSGEIYGKYSLFLKVLGESFNYIDNDVRLKIIEKILLLNFDDKSKIYSWVWASLHNIPDKYWNEKVKERLNQLAKQYDFPEYKKRVPIRSTGFQAAKPPVSLEVLRSKSPDELYSFLVAKNNLKDHWDFDSNVFYGGVEELAQTVAQLFVDDLSKYKEVIKKLSKDTSNDEYVAWFFYGHEKKETQKEDLKWIIDIVNLCVSRERLEIPICRYLESIAGNVTGQELSKLKDAILKLSNSRSPEKDDFYDSRADGYGNDALGDGINRTRGALASLIIKLLQRFNNDWLVDILYRLADDKTISVRAALVRYLPYAIKHIGWDKCFDVFSIAFKKGPEEYSDCISRFLQYAPKECMDNVQHLLDSMYSKKETRLAIPFAVLNTVCYFRGMKTLRELEAVLKDNDLSDDAKSESCDLIANQVRFVENVDKSLDAIRILLKEKSNLFRNPRSLFRQAREDDFNKFIDVIDRLISTVDNRGDWVYYLFEYFKRCLLRHTLEVFSFLEKILANLEKSKNISDRYVYMCHSKVPLDILNMVFECYPEEEERALRALDSLIVLRWEGVDQYLSAIERI